ncbi:MAG: imidazole glycerol phosphate synthase subunit HisH [Candidatus Bathyarchaeia archaeon]
MPKIAIIDYGLGNLRSIRKGLEKAGAEAYITREADVCMADAVVLPGVGAFEEAIKNLKPLSHIVYEQVQLGKPLLGVCLGLQLLFSVSTEGGLRRGLDVFEGKVVELPSNVKVPHMGWNTLKIVKPENPLVNGLPNNSYAYFVHSYYGEVEDKKDVVAETTYGIVFPSILSKGNVFATQFHPERSATTGIKILKNFVNYVKR